MTYTLKPKNPLWIMDCFGRILDYDLRRGMPLRRHLVLGDYPSLYLDGDNLHTGRAETNAFCYIHKAEKKLPDFYIIPQEKDCVAFQNAENKNFLSMNPASWYPLWLVNEVNDWEKILLIETDTFHAFGLLDDPAASKIYDQTGKEVFFEPPNASFAFYRVLGECNFNFLDNIEAIRTIAHFPKNSQKEFSLKNYDGEEYIFSLKRTDFEIPEFDGAFNPYF